MCNHYNLNESDRELVVSKIERLKKFYERISEVSVILDASGNQNLAEILVWGPHVNLRVKEDAPDMRTAFEAALNKAERSLAKTKEKIKAHRSKGGRRNVSIRRFDPVYFETSLEPEGTTAESRLPEIPAEDMEPKPMSLDEAHLQMNTLNRGLLVFVNSETEEINILHRNKANEVELVVH
jgi:putative sigma-54 modulation protein